MRIPATKVFELVQRAQKNFAHSLDPLRRLLARHGTERCFNQALCGSPDFCGIRIQRT